MEHPGFYDRAGPLSLSDILAQIDAKPAGDVDLTLVINDVKTLDDAKAGDISFLDNPKYLSQFEETMATACLLADKFVKNAPKSTALLVCGEPYRAFAQVLRLFYPQAMLTRTCGTNDAMEGAAIHPSAVIEEGVRIETGAVIGEEVHIGRGSVVAAGATLGYRVYIGRDCYVGPNANLTHALIGDNVVIHAGVGIGQDGFGFAMGPQGHLKVPQIGRVVVQDDVEIGANSTIDRGALRDTIIGQGTKIDNLVQIGHNVVIGRHCVIVAQCGISGSTVLEDFVALGGQCAVIGHVRIGMGAQLAATSGVNSDIPAGGRWGGVPAKPVRDWFREIAILKKLGQKTGGGKTREAASE